MLINRTVTDCFSTWHTIMQEGQVYLWSSCHQKPSWLPSTTLAFFQGLVSFLFIWCLDFSRCTQIMVSQSLESWKHFYFWWVFPLMTVICEEKLHSHEICAGLHITLPSEATFAYWVLIPLLWWRQERASVPYPKDVFFRKHQMMSRKSCSYFCLLWE